MTDLKTIRNNGDVWTEPLLIVDPSQPMSKKVKPVTAYYSRENNVTNRITKETFTRLMNAKVGVTK